MSVTHDRPLPTSDDAAENPRKGWPGQARPDQRRKPSLTLTDRVADAEARIAPAQNPALYAAMSDREINAAIKAEEGLRKLERREHVAERKAEIAERAQEAKRERRIRSEDADEDDRGRREAARLARWRRRAASDAEQLTSKDIELARLARQMRLQKRGLLSAVVVAMTWSAVNVQHNMVPSGDKADPLYWISFGVDGVLSIALIALMMTSATAARWGSETALADARWYEKMSSYALELGLILVLLGLNVGSPLVAGELGTAAKFGIPTLAVGFLVWVYNNTTRRLSKILVEASRPAPALVLDESNGEVVADAVRAFALMAEGILQPSMDANGGGAPAGGQLARHLKLSKPAANNVRDLMKSIIKGEIKIVAPTFDQVERPVVPMLSRAQ